MRIGIIGNGRIASRFLKEVDYVNDAKVSAIYNPHEGSAAAFVGKMQDSIVGDYGNAVGGLSRFKLPEPVSDIKEFWNLVDAVYIASPHETHLDYAMEALKNGKHVLCEKPFAFDKADVKKAFKLAETKGVVLMEGLKTAYMPGFKQILEVAKSGIIGDIVQVNGAFTKLVPEDSRELNGEAAGSFIELGTYGMLAIFSILGIKYKAARFDSLRNKKGVDIFTVAHFDYGNAFATCTAGLGVKVEGSLVVAGTKGYITVQAPWWYTRHFEVHFEDPKKIISYDEEMEGDGLRYEIREFVARAAGKEPSVEVDLEAVSISMAEVMGRFLKGDVKIP